MKKLAAGVGGAIVAALLGGPPPVSAVGQQAGFYDVDREVKIEGPVQDVRLEPRFENTQPFVVVKVEDKATGRTYTVEIAPAWFFDQDIHRGERLAVVGSLVSKAEASPVVMAREVQCRGETIRVRDRKGFPNWRGGAMRQGKRKRGPIT